MGTLQTSAHQLTHKNIIKMRAAIVSLLCLGFVFSNPIMVDPLLLSRSLSAVERPATDMQLNRKIWNLIPKNTEQLNKIYPKVLDGTQTLQLNNDNVPLAYYMSYPQSFQLMV